MTEKILLLPGANGTELTRMLARFNKNSLGLRIMNAAELARFALMRSGIVLEENFLPRKQEPAVIDSFIRDITYFASAGYADSEKIADAFYRLRSLIPENEFEQIHKVLPQGEFKDKNNSLVVAYDRYLATLKAGNNIDTIGLLRKAISVAAPLSCPIHTLQEYPLTPLEDALVNHLTDTRVDSCLTEMLGVAAETLRNIDYTECYGSSNEVEAIFDYITANNLPFDKCIIAVTNTAQYAQLFYDFAQSHNLPITLGCGIPILNANPARLLKLLYDWNGTGYHGVDALSALLHSDAIDQKKLLATLGLEKARDLNRVIEIAGQLRLDFHKEENSTKISALPEDGRYAYLYPCVSALAEELALGESKFIEKYALIRDSAIGRVDRSALSVICDTLDAYAKYTGGSPLDQIIPEILQRSVCSENSREGALFVTGISGAMASIRKHLFVVGMAASNFPGMPRENYLLLDSDYLLFDHQDAAPTSVNLIAQKRKSLDDLLTLAAALDVNTHISYSGYDLAALKEENPSSVLFDVFKQQHGQDATLKQYKDAFRHIGYFGQQVSDDHTIGHAYIQGKEIQFDSIDFSETACAYTGDKAFSPTAIDDFFNCPRHFFLTNILGIQEPEEDDPFTVIDPAATGSLAHSLMEELAHSACDKDAFLQRAADAFDRFLQTRPPIHRDSAAREKTLFCKMMGNAYDQDPKNEVLASEEKQTFRHSSGVLLHGYPDRVEKTAEGEYIIADYKTGKRVKHLANDIDTCMQVVIYAYLMEQKNLPISRCEYRYLRDGITIPCRYDDSMKEKLDAKLAIFKNALTTGQFPVAESSDACRYCTLAGICGRYNEEKEEAE